MIMRATDTDGVTLECAQSRRGLAGIDNARLRALGQRAHIVARLGRDAAHPLSEVQGHALTAENRGRRSRDRGGDGTWFELIAICHMPHQFKVFVHLTKDLGDHIEARHHHVLSGPKVSGSDEVRGDAGVGGEVTAG